MESPSLMLSPSPRWMIASTKWAAKFFSKFDLLKGYWQVPLAKRAQEMSSFTTPSGLYSYKVKLFGLRNSLHPGHPIYVTVLIVPPWSKHMDMALHRGSRAVCPATKSEGKLICVYTGGISVSVCVREQKSSVRVVCLVTGDGGSCDCALWFSEQHSFRECHSL